MEGLILPLLLIVMMYFLLIRPQQKRMKDQRSMQASLGPGDYVLTSSGIYGTITELEDDTMLLEISDGIDIRIAKGAVIRKVDGFASGAGATAGDTGAAADEADAPAFPEPTGRDAGDPANPA